MALEDLACPFFVYLCILYGLLLNFLYGDERFPVADPGTARCGDKDACSSGAVQLFQEGLQDLICTRGDPARAHMHCDAGVSLFSFKYG